MVTVRRRYRTLAVRPDGHFVAEFGSFVRGEAMAEMTKWRRSGIRSDLKIVASDPDPAAIAEAVEVLNDT